jgi:two-component system, chemotaxis family, CheB/CheR fusion protein
MRKKMSRPAEQPQDDGARSVVAADARPADDVPVVGVGASAGALEAFKKLLQVIPPDTGIAFVLIPHLDPTHQSLLADHLARWTRMPVIEAQDDMRVEPNHVYVIPPNKYIRLADHGLFLDQPVKQRGIRMPIDHFFYSLAEVQRERAICIILSGTGSDGTLGLKEVKAAGGLVMVQQPETAEYDGMPRSAIHTGLADFVLPIEEMPNALIRFTRHPYLKNHAAPGEHEAADPSTFRAVLELLRAQTDHDFLCYKKGTLIRRIHRRMGLAQIDDLADYLQRLRTDPQEAERLVKDLLIGVTHFFRDGEGWAQLDEHVVERLVAERDDGDPIRVWVPGCATGEEAYSLSILFFEAFEKFSKRCALQIFATDVDRHAIAIARAGFYPANIAAEVSAARLGRYFTEENGGYRVNKRLRDSCIFAVQNIIADPPFSNLDLICCRNLFIYLEPEVQQKTLEILRYALKEGGFLFLGPSESLGKLAKGFQTISKRWRIYRRQNGGPPTHPPFPTHLPRAPAERGTSRDPSRAGNIELARRILLERYAPASVLVNHKYEVQYFHGPLNNYLAIPSGRPTHELLPMAREGLASKLRIALHRALQGKRSVQAVARNMKRNGGSIDVRITVDPVALPNSDPMLLVSFEDAKTEGITEAPPSLEVGEAPSATTHADPTIISQLQFELQSTREELQNTIEELETANEELKVSNEEAMSMNEEFQSTNEELETSREELQSLNEELTTVNAQLEDKIAELEGTNNDLNNLLSSTDIATIFLDTQLRIRRFTPAAREVLKVIDSDVGRPISDLAPRVNDTALIDDARQVLAKLSSVEKEVHDDGGKWFLRRIVAYRTTENRIEGVVITFADVTRLKETAQQLERRERQQAGVAQLSGEALGGLEPYKLVRRACELVCTLTAADLAEVRELGPDRKTFLRKAGIGWTEGPGEKSLLLVGPDSLAGYTLQSGAPVIFEDLAREKRFRAGELPGEQGVVSGASVVIGPLENSWGVLGAYTKSKHQFTIDDVNFLQLVANLIWDAITRARQETSLAEQRSRLSRIIAGAQIGIGVVRSDGKVSEVNDSLLDMLGLTRTEFEAKGLDWRALDWPELDHDMARLRSEGRVAPRELTLRSKSGARVPVVASARRLEGGEDEHVFFLTDLTPLKTAEAALRQSEQRFEQAISGVSAIVYEVDVGTGIVTWAGNIKRIFGVAGEDIEPTVEWWLARLHPDDRPALQAAITEINSEVRGQFELEYRLRHEDGQWLTIWDRGYVEGEHGRPTKVIGFAIDITDRKRSEERLKLLTRELNHRVKNILATVAAIIQQSKTERAAEEYAEALRGRIEALARAHELLSTSRWEGVDLRSLFETELAPWASEDGKNVRLEGCDVILTAPAAQSLAMAIHELATNAAKYGALSQPSGRVDVSWRSDTGAGTRLLRIEWHESGGPPVESPGRKGFGSLMLNTIVPHELGGRVDLDYGKGGLVCRLLLSAQHYSEREAGGELHDAGVGGKEAAALPSVLIAEDVGLVAAELANHLRASGFDVVGPVSRLGEGLRAAEDERVAAAIIDLNLQGESAVPLIRRLKDRGIRVLVTSGYQIDGALSDELRDVPCLAKPYRPSDLMQRLRELVANTDQK